MYQSYPVPTFFLVHRKDLLLQAQKRFEKYGISPGIIGAGIFKPDPHLNIATTQTVLSILKKEDERTAQTKALIEGASQVFFDESHIMAASQDKGNQFMEVGGWFKNAHARWGLTATPFMRSQYDNFLLEGVTGSVLAQVSSAWLIKNGYLVPPKIKFIKVPGKLPVKVEFGRSNKAKAEHWRKVQMKGITCNSWRNKKIAAEIVAGPHPCLVLVKHVEQAKEITNGFTFGFNVPVLTGKSSLSEREQAVWDLQSGKLKAVITTLWDEGVDIPEIRKVIMASGGKSQVKLLQRVGRGVRVAANKKEVEIIDFGDQHNPMLRRHALERIRVWKQEGFEVTEA
jgi:superfamily II DNA or RNA helicase